MQLHLPQLPHTETGWQTWARGIAVVLGMIAAPVVLALVWLLVLRGLFT